MDARVIDKVVELEGRRFIVRKFDVFTGVKVAKLLVAKLLPVLQPLVPALKDGIKDADAQAKDDLKGLGTQALDMLDEAFSMEKIAHLIDAVSREDLDFLMRSALCCCFEQLPAGLTPVLYANGTYGVEDVQYDMLLGMQLIYEAIAWSVSDFFTENRLRSFLNLPQDSSQPTQ